MATMEFKIGDHVVVEKSNVDQWHYGGKTGVINRVDPYYAYPYRITMDDGSAPSWCTVRGLVTNSEKIVITHDGKVTTATMYGVMGKKTTATARCAPEDKFDFAVGAKLAMERLMAKANPINIGGFKVGDRVNFNGINGTVICLAASGMNRIGVEFDKATNIAHRCEAVSLIAGTTGKKCTCRWLTPSEIAHGEVPEPPKYYNGKVVCIKADTEHWTVGKIYEVKDGIVYSNLGWKHPRFDNTPYKDADDIRHIGSQMWADERHNPLNEFLPIVEDKNDPLTIEELNKMDGQKVWLLSLGANKKPYEDNFLGGWHTVDIKTNRLVDDKGRYYPIKDNDTEYGFHAYRTAPRK